MEREKENPTEVIAKELNELFSNYGMEFKKENIQYIAAICNQMIPKNDIDEEDEYVELFLQTAGDVNSEIYIKNFEKFAKKTMLSGDWKGIPSWFGKKIFYKKDEFLEKSYVSTQRGRYSVAMETSAYFVKGKKGRKKGMEFFEKKIEEELGDEYRLKKLFDDRIEDQQLTDKIVQIYRQVDTAVRVQNLLKDFDDQAKEIIKRYFRRKTEEKE